MKPQYTYATSCVNLDDDVDSLNKMIDGAKNVTLRTIRKHCRGFDQWCKQQGYSTGNQRDGGLHICNDFHVSYHKSKFKGRKCFYVRWSAIEYIWVIT